MIMHGHPWVKDRTERERVSSQQRELRLAANSPKIHPPFSPRITNTCTRYLNVSDVVALAHLQASHCFFSPQSQEAQRHPGTREQGPLLAMGQYQTK